MPQVGQAQGGEMLRGEHRRRRAEGRAGQGKGRAKRSKTKEQGKGEGAMGGNDLQLEPSRDSAAEVVRPERPTISYECTEPGLPAGNTRRHGGSGGLFYCEFQSAA